MNPASRVLLTGVCVALLVLTAGCRPKDPFQWKIDASTPAKLNKWNGRRAPKMPPDVAKLYSAAFHTLLETTPGAITRYPDDASNPLCLKLNGVTVRDAILEAYAARLENYSRQITLGTERLTKNIERSEAEGLSPGHRTNFAGAIDSQRAQLARWEERLLAEQKERDTFKAAHP